MSRAQSFSLRRADGPHPRLCRALATSFLALLAAACSEAPASGSGAELDGDGDAATDTSQLELDLSPPDLSDTSATDLANDAEPAVTLTLRIQSHGSEFLAPHWVREWFLWSMPYNQTMDLALGNGPVEPTPVAEARVALDLADGTRLGEAKSNEDGRVSFTVPGDQWPVSVTAHASGYLMHTVTAIARPKSPEPELLTIFPRWRDLGPMVRLEGTTRRLDPFNSLYVTVVTPYGDWRTSPTNDWELDTMAGMPFDLVAAEHNYSRLAGGFLQPVHRWLFASFEAVDEDTVVAIDFRAHEAVPTVHRGSFELPEREASPLRQIGTDIDLYVAPRTSRWTGAIGIGTSALREGHLVSFTVEVVAAAMYPGTFYEYRVDSGSGSSVAAGFGLPEGALPRLLDLPSWFSRSRGGRGHPIGEPLRWEIFDDDVAQSVLIRNGLEVRWVVEVAGDTAEVTLPAPPSGVDIDELLGVAPSAAIALERPIDVDDGVFHLVSWGRTLRLDLTAWQEGTR